MSTGKLGPLLIIANELAEANRLKRFELSRLYPQTNYLASLHRSVEVYPKEDLEDQA